MRKELDHFNIGYSYGGNQDWFSSYMMRLGGCGAETACDTSIYLAKYKGERDAYPGDLNHLTRKSYVDFSNEMEHYLWPRMSGIDKTSIWVDGYSKYLGDHGIHNITMTTVEGNRPYEDAENAVRTQIDKGLPVPFLTLRHKDRRYRDYVWHWYLVNGYRTAEGLDGEHFLVKAVTYSEYEWLDLARLWDTGYSQKGGIVLLSLDENGSAAAADQAKTASL